MGLYDINSNALNFGINPATGTGLTMNQGNGLNFAGGMGRPSATQGFELGWNAPTLNMGLNGINMLGNLWGSFQANKLARDQLDFTKNITNTNLNNSIQSYNTALDDRARSRGVAEGQSAAQVQDYVTANRLSR